MRVVTEYDVVILLTTNTPSPLDAKGCLISPGLLQVHSQTHKFPMPKCFHGSEATLVLTRNHHGKKKDFVDFICGQHGRGNDCKFRINVDRLVASSVSLTCTRYGTRESGGTSSHDFYLY